MGTPRNVSNPVMKTYIVPTATPTGTSIHVRVYAPRFALDKRGSGATLDTALKHALHGVHKSHRRKVSRSH